MPGLKGVKNQEAAGQGRVHGQVGAFVAAGFRLDLDENRLTGAQQRTDASSINSGGLAAGRGGGAQVGWR